MCIKSRPFQRVSCSHQEADKPISQPLTSTQLLIGPHKGKNSPLDFVASRFATEKGVEAGGSWLGCNCKSCSCKDIKGLLDLDIPNWVTLQLFALPQFDNRHYSWSPIWPPLEEKVTTGLHVVHLTWTCWDDMTHWVTLSLRSEDPFSFSLSLQC